MRDRAFRGFAATLARNPVRSKVYNPGRDCMTTLARLVGWRRSALETHISQHLLEARLVLLKDLTLCGSGPVKSILEILLNVFDFLLITTCASWLSLQSIWIVEA